MAKDTKTLIQWLIEKIDGDAYRAGRLSGKKHFPVDKELFQSLGGRESFLSQAKEIEKDERLGKTGKIEFRWHNMNLDIQTIHCSVDVMPELCKREGLEDPRDRQLRYIELLNKWKERAGSTWLARYYEDEIRKLEKGKCSQTLKDDMKTEHLYRCLDEILHMEEAVEKPIFSVRVFKNVKLTEEHLTPSKVFRNRYEGKTLSVLREYSPFYIEGMSDDEVLTAHGILSYAQTLEWKGPLVYLLDETETIDTSRDRYGTILGAQTLEHAVPESLLGVRKIIIIENKANYERMRFCKDELYIFCHGFFSPKEVHFLKKITDAADSETKYYHWGDMDYGGIRIFQFNKANVFSKLKPYKMGKEDYDKAIAAGAGVPIEAKKKEKLEKMDAGELEELKACILEKGLEIEQEFFASSPSNM